ncbi:hypothetical protein [Sediminibacter sp. Hel_I_10]|uniref:hypothetical protein n=1 Tax=Sediminibacter sp. Hel_I_10 TaxID=1392490 RepID=UPI0012DF07A0|nr:hypothetical protein [Sediminibacter sp. Hel_I_10]
MIEIIKKKMLDTKLEHPFSSSDFFKFFNYSHHRDFKRYLDNPKFYKKIVFNDYGLVVSRSAETVLLNREMFLIVCEHRKIHDDKIMSWYYQYCKDKIKKSTEHFPNLKKGEPHTLRMYNRPAGIYYSHSLNTINLSEAIRVDPYDLYKFCAVELQWRHCAVRAEVVNSGMYKGGQNIPYLSYDSTDSEYRLSYINLLRLISEEYPLNHRQKKLLKHYKKCIISLVEKVIAIEHKKRFYKEKASHLNKKAIQHYVDIKALKATLREGAKLFHPDKNPEGLELFKEFNKHYINRDLGSMRAMVVQFKRSA